MSSRFKTLILTTSLGVLITSAAQAEERWPRWYLGLTGGVDFKNDSDISNAISGNAEYDTGYSFGASIGYMPAFKELPMNMVRLEAEVNYRSSSLSDITVGGVSGTGSGDMQNLAGMLNLFLDAPTGSNWTPYVGGGLGFSTVQFDNGSGFGNTDDEDTVFAYQFMGGLAYSPETIPSTRFTLGYRYFGSEDAEYAVPGGTIEVSNDSHNVELGAQFRF